MSENADIEKDVSARRHMPECDMSLCFIEQDKECSGERFCMRPNCNQYCMCQKLRWAFHRGWKAGQEAKEATTLDYGKRKYREGVLNLERNILKDSPYYISRTEIANSVKEVLGF